MAIGDSLFCNLFCCLYATLRTAGLFYRLISSVNRYGRFAG